MWTAEHSVISAATPEQIYQCLVDHDTWTQWDAGLEWVRLDAAVAVGTTGVLRPDGGPDVKFYINALESNRRYCNISSLPLTKLLFDHIVEPHENGSKLTHRVEITGLLTPLFSRKVGREIHRDMPKTMAALAEFAQQR